METRPATWPAAEADMGSYDISYMKLFLAVLTDFRVIAATIAILLVWVLLRYAGVVFRRARLNLPPPRKLLRQRKSAPAEASAGFEEEA